MKTQHYEIENSNCFRVVPANYFVVLCSFIEIIKLALSNSYADPEIPFPFHLWRYSPFCTLVSLRRRLHFYLSSAGLHHPYIPKISDVTLLTTSSIPVRVFPTGIHL